MRRGTSKLDTKKTGVGVVDIQCLGFTYENVLIKDVLLETTHPSAISQDFLSQKKWQGVLVVSTLEG